MRSFSERFAKGKLRIAQQASDPSAELELSLLKGKFLAYCKFDEVNLDCQTTPMLRYVVDSPRAKTLKSQTE